MADLDAVIADLVIANRILGREGVCDAFGHISVRHPDQPDRYLLSCSRAPERLQNRIRRLPGVTEVETRVRADVTLDVPGMVDAAAGRLLSLPDLENARLNRVRLRQGRLPEPGRGRRQRARSETLQTDGGHADRYRWAS